MPTYVCTTRVGALDDDKQSDIAAVIARAHSEATGAPQFFVQTNFVEVQVGRRYLGTVATDGHVWIRGDIRAGRSRQARGALMQAVMSGVARMMSLDPQDVWVCLNELEPTDMIEYGHVLPAPGEEQAWFDSLPEALRDYLSHLGAKREAFRL